MDLRGDFVFCDASQGAYTATLPPPAVVGAGYVIAYKKTDASANAVTIAPAGGETIDGQSSVQLTIPYQSVQVATNGANWFLLPVLPFAGGVQGPESSTDNALALWDGTDGSALKNSPWVLDPTTGAMTVGGTGPGLVSTGNADIAITPDGTGRTRVANLTATGSTEVADLTATGTTQVADLTATGTTQVADLTATGTTQVADLTATGTTQVADLTAIGMTQVADLTATGTTQVADLTTTGTTQVGGPIEATDYDNIGDVSGTATVTPAAYSRIRLTGDTAVTLTAASAGALSTQLLEVVQDGTGGWTPTFTGYSFIGTAPGWASQAADTVTLLGWMVTPTNLKRIWVIEEAA